MHAELYSCVSSGLCGLWTVQRQVMKILPILVLAFASSALCAPHPRGKAAQQVKYSSSGQELYFEQPLDHFNYIIDHTWRQRYFLTGVCIYYTMDTVANHQPGQCCVCVRVYLATALCTSNTISVNVAVYIVIL